MLNSIIDLSKESNYELQNKCLSILFKLFFKRNVTNLIDNSYFFEGVRGKFNEKENYCLRFDFSYFSYNIEFYLSYDQLEYYFIKNNKLIKKCNIEDFCDENSMILKFINQLNKDLSKLEIPFSSSKS